MAYTLKVNIKKGKDIVKRLANHKDNEHTARYLYDHALDLIQNHFQIYIKPFEIFQGKDSTEQHMYWKVQPKGKKEHATIIIDKK